MEPFFQLQFFIGYFTLPALERCIRKEPFVYPKARTLIKQHAALFNVLEKNFEIITELFSVQIWSYVKI